MPIIYANWVGGQDDLVFDGGSCIVNEKGQIIQQAPFFKEQLWETFLPQTHASLPFKKIDPIEHIYAALVLGTRDYMIKNQFPSALIGLSGGLDSALTLAIAVDAVGKSNVKTIMMPSRFTSDLSLHYAKRQADLLGVSYEVISIEPIFTPFLQILSLSEKGLTAENLQARCRGMLLMALSNKTGSIVLTTGNKSELAVGYTTLYGDMAGGFAPLKDIYKTMAYRLAAYKNKNATTILPEIIARAPSAELAPNQKDQDSLPPYEVLDKLLFDYIEKNKSLTQLVESGFNKTQAKEIIERVCRSEYKRKQAPLGVKISPQAFGSDWRYPITTKACTKAY